MKRIIVIFLIGMSLLACKKDKNKDDLNKINVSNENILDNKSDEYLTIKGNQIWIRQKPSVGKVVMKLDEGTKCKILEKGKKETINDETDFWYFIEYKGKQGWVFGSQTDIKEPKITDNNSLDSKTEISDFIKDFINSYSTNQDQFKQYFIKDSLYELYNPGAIVYIKKVSTKEFFVKNTFLKNLSNLKDKFVFDKEPNFNMDSYKWEDNGMFINIETRKDIFSYLINFGKDQELVDYTDSFINQASKDEKLITYKLTITLGDGIIIYFGKINNSFKIIAIDVSTNDA